MVTSCSIHGHSNTWNHYGFNHAEYCFCWLWLLVACSCVCFVISNCELMFNWGTLKILCWDALLQRGSVFTSALHLEALKSRTLFCVFPQQKFCIELPAWETLYYLHPPLEKEMATHSSTLAWKIPWMDDPGRLQFMGSQRVRQTEWLHFKDGEMEIKRDYAIWAKSHRMSRQSWVWTQAPWC